MTLGLSISIPNPIYFATPGGFSISISSSTDVSYNLLFASSNIEEKSFAGIEALEVLKLSGVAGD